MGSPSSVSIRDAAATQPPRGSDATASAAASAATREPSTDAVGAAPLEHIDALRGWAVVAVVFRHACTFVQPDAVGLPGATAAAFGVTLFYLVSAFTLYTSFFRSRAGEPRPVWRFFARRFFRVAPMYYVAIALSLIVFGMGPRPLAPRGLTAGHVAYNLLFLHGWHPIAINGVIFGGWSVAVEMNFYLVLPLCFAFVTSLRRAIFMLVGTIAASVAVTPIALTWLAASFPYLSPAQRHAFVYFWPPAQLPVFALGIILYYVTERLADHPSRPRWGRWALAASVIGLATAGRWVTPVSLPGWLVYTLLLATFAWSLGARDAPIMSNVVVRWLGRVSFSVYLLHYPVMFYIVKLGIAGDGTSRMGLFMLFGAALAIAGPLSYVTYVYVEKPGIALGKRIASRWLI